MEQSRIDRINQLARKAKIDELSEEEKQEQKLLREEYVKACKENLKNSLESMGIKGNKDKKH